MLNWFFVIIILISMNYGYCADFGEYKYSKYLGLQQQIRNQQMANIRRQRLYNQNPVRNIRYPRYSTQYPNIERTKYSQYPNINRYSRQYYELRYGN